MNNTTSNTEPAKSLNFIEQIIEKDLFEGKNEKRVHTRFPPEPNGYLHIGHAKSICLNFGLAQKYNGYCNLRFDDTNPTKEEEEYVNSIMEDVKWLGFDWENRLYYASDYFGQLYQWAEKMIMEGKAYVDDQSAEQVSEQRGTVTTPGKHSPFRDRTVDENLDLFRRMRAGEFPDGTRVLRAKIDMAHPNMLLRDPLMYRILHATHHRTGDNWCIYPMYDYAHGQSDYLEGITHSICTLEFEVHRPLYDWFLDQVIDTRYRPQQIEFARLNLSYTIMSKRRLLELVEGGFVRGWDDPRMPTICGLRRRGYTPDSIRYFADKIGVAKRDNTIDVSLLEHSIREDLNKKAPRVMAVINPLRVVITNYPENKTEEIELVNNPEDESAGMRTVPFSRALYIEQDDFMETPPPKYFRLSPGTEVRLKGAYIIKCEKVVKDPVTGAILEVQCTYDPDTRSGGEQSHRKVKSTIHWLPEPFALPAEIRLYDRLFLVEDPSADKGKDYKALLNPDSLKIVQGFVEPSLQSAGALDKFQFIRLGYFCADPDAGPDHLVFNRTVTLKDTWAKLASKE